MSILSSRFDVHQEITDRIVAAMETAGPFRPPWVRRSGGALGRPINVASKASYNGVNVLGLWIAALSKDYPSNVWGSYRQWLSLGQHVRRGEKASLVVFYKKIEAKEEEETRERLVARASWVFNAAQTTGFAVEEQQDAPVFDPIPRAEVFAELTGAQIVEGGDSACYAPAEDLIRMPDRNRFVGSATSAPAESFYSTLCHELIHWSGARTRLDRDLTGRFGNQAYAMEELVAELGAAFLCADLGLTQEPREDHAAYLKSWLAVLKQDKRAIFTAASKASQAATWLMGLEQRAAQGEAA